MRPPISEIRKEITQARRRLAELNRDLAAALAERDAAILADWDAGMARSAIAQKHMVAYQTLSNVLHNAGRTERQRRAASLTAEQAAVYQRSLRQGISSRIARRIACGES